MRADAAPRERLVRANGLDHHVLEWGAPDAPETFVLCHGFLDLAWSFAELGPALAAAGHRVLAADFRGHGESGRVPEGGYYYFPDYVLDLHLLLPQLVTRPFHLVGHSMGATVCAMFAATHPREVRTLSLLEGIGPRSEDPARAKVRTERWLTAVTRVRTEPPPRLADRAEACARLRARHTEAPAWLLSLLADKSTCPHPSGEGLAFRFDPLHRTESPIPFDRARFIQHLASIEAPTLVMQAEHGFRRDDDAERIARIPRTRHEVVAGAGHMLHWTHCGQVAQSLFDHAL